MAQIYSVNAFELSPIGFTPQANLVKQAIAWDSTVFMNVCRLAVQVFDAVRVAYQSGLLSKRHNQQKSIG